MSNYEEMKRSSRTSTTRASDVRGGYYNPRPAGDTSGQGRGADFGSAGGNAQGTPRKTYTARAKFSEYLDDVAQRDRYLKTATRSTNIMGRPTLTFSRREDELNFKSAAADVRMFENNNLECDRGNSASCQLAGRGDAPTEYASPFISSEHFNDVAYFGGGGRRQVDENAKTTFTAPAPAPADDEFGRPRAETAVPPENPPAPAPASTDDEFGRPVPPETPAERLARMIEEEGGEDEIEPDVPETGSSGSVLQPNKNEHRDPFSGGGVHPGGEGSASHENEGVHRFDGGRMFRKEKKPNSIKQLLNNLNGMRNPYGEHHINARGEQCFGEMKAVAM